uniref:Uncharacterized protein n=1 Tax=Ixodes ricinus TaxID=34613 RepID=A0A6B0ULD2_IXORI
MVLLKPTLRLNLDQPWRFLLWCQQLCFAFLFFSFHYFYSKFCICHLSEIGGWFYIALLCFLLSFLGGRSFHYDYYCRGGCDDGNNHLFRCALETVAFCTLTLLSRSVLPFLSRIG